MRDTLTILLACLGFALIGTFGACQASYDQPEFEAVGQ